MTNDDRIEFAKTLAAMAAAYDFECDEACAEGFWITLNDLPLDKVKAAIHKLMRESKFRPKAAEIREIVVDELEREGKAADRELRITRGYCESIAANIVRSERKNGATDEDIREKLRTESLRLGIDVYWPGEEPWNQRSKDAPRVEFKRP